MRRRFLASLNRLPPDWPFASDRKSRALRVVLLGESTPAMKELQQALLAGLKIWWPDVRWEIGRAAIGGNDIGSTEALFHQALRFSPDIIVLYFGHNAAFQFPRAFAPGSSFLQLFDHSYFLREIISLGVAIRSRSSRLVPEQPPDRRLKEAFVRICRECRKKGVILVMCVPAGNMSFPPAPRADISKARHAGFARSLGSAMFWEERKQWEMAREAYSRLTRHYPRMAEVHFRLGRILGRLGRWREAKSEFISAVDIDPRKIRATSAVRAAIKETARRCDCLEADIESTLERWSPHGVSGASLFSDNCHPRRSGVMLIAASTLAALAASPAVEARLGAARREPLLRTSPAKLSGDLSQRISMDFRYAIAFAIRENPGGDFPATRYFLKDGFALASSTFTGMLESITSREIEDIAAAERANIPDEKGCDKIKRAVWIQAAIAARHMGLGTRAHRLLADALRPGADSRELAMAEIQEAVEDFLAGRAESGRNRRLRAATLWPPIRNDPWFYCSFPVLADKGREHRAP